jgi:hypothetical protein
LVSAKLVQSYCGQKWWQTERQRCVDWPLFKSGFNPTWSNPVTWR